MAIRFSLYVRAKHWPICGAANPCCLHNVFSTQEKRMKFCSACGASIKILVPAGDNRERHVCVSCETIHYHNPRIITGCLPIYQDKVLMCRRAIEPLLGFWPLPAGFLDP